VTRLVEADKELPGHQPREFNVGLAYGLPNDWLAFGRIGIQDTSSNQTLVDVGFEKMFFESLTFRVGTQRRYASQKGESAEESRSSLSGGLEYRLGAFGKGYRYPEKDADLFSQQTLVRIFHNTQVGMNVTLTRVPGNANHTSNDNTSLIVTLGKAF